MCVGVCVGVYVYVYVGVYVGVYVNAFVLHISLEASLHVSGHFPSTASLLNQRQSPTTQHYLSPTALSCGCWHPPCQRLRQVRAMLPQLQLGCIELIIPYTRCCVAIDSRQ